MFSLWIWFFFSLSGADTCSRYIPIQILYLEFVSFFLLCVCVIHVSAYLCLYLCTWRFVYVSICLCTCLCICVPMCLCACVCVTLRNGKVDHHSAAPLPVSTVNTCICAPYVAAHLHMHIPTYTCVYAVCTIAMCTVCTMWFPMLCVIKWSQEGSFCWFTGFMHRQREHRKGPLGTGRDKRGKHMFYRRMNSPGSTYIWLTATALMIEIHNIGLCQPD